MPTLFDQLVQLIEQEFYDVDFLDHQWPDIKASLAAQYRTATGVDQQEALLQQAVQSLPVSHAVLLTPALKAKIAQQEEHPRRLRPVITAYGNVVVAQIRSFKVRTTTVADIQQFAEACQTATHLILDLRLNDGGAGSVVVELASRLLPADTPVLRIRDRLGFHMARPHQVTSFPENRNLDHEAEVQAIQQYHYVEYRTRAAADPLFRGEIIVVVDSRCYSCGEIFVQAMKEHTQAAMVGAPSAGFVVAAADYPLSHGYGVMIPFAEMRSGRDVMLEGTGVEPHIKANVTDLDNDQLLNFLAGLNLLG